MANLGFSQSQNLAEADNGAEIIENLAGGGSIAGDIRLFAGSSTRKSYLSWNRFENTTLVTNTPSDIKPGTRFNFETVSLYSDDDTVRIVPINIIKDIDYAYVGFDDDGTVIQGSGSFISFEAGENYPANQTFTNIELTGGSGTGARATLTTDSNGLVSSVRITDNGQNYVKDDVLKINPQGNGATLISQGGEGFSIRIIGAPWKAVVVANFAWDVNDLNTKNLEVEFAFTNSSLDGIYQIRKVNGRNVWLQPSNGALTAYEVNARIFAQNKISKNELLFDVDGDGVFSAFDAQILKVWFITPGNDAAKEAAIDDYINAGNPIPSQAVRTNSEQFNIYIKGLNSSLFDVDGTGLYSTQPSISGDYLIEYVDNGGIFYIKDTASNLIASGTKVNSSSINHTIYLEVRINQNPGYTIPPEDTNSPPYFILYASPSASMTNVFDNFRLYGTKQRCTTDLTTYLSIQTDTYNTTFNYRVTNKFTSIVGGITQYFVDIVIIGSGFGVGQTIGNLTVISQSPVVESNNEYGIFDSNVVNQFFLKTNPRVVAQSSKEIVLFAEKYKIVEAGNFYNNKLVSTTSLVPDLTFTRDDKLTTNNILNLNPPEIIDDGTAIQGVGVSADSFGYDVNTNQYGATLQSIIDTVDQSTFIISTKYRRDRRLYYEKNIKVQGFVSSFDPDGFNVTDESLLEDLSPGIYISSAVSQITNPLASDYANKTRSFSSEYNPWKDDRVANALSTTSLNVTINDLVWVNEIKLDVGASPNNGYEQGITGQSLDSNFNASTVTAKQSFKLRTLINGEEFFIILRKP